jgi:ATP-binding protein involved in chromosome partitioning
MADAPAHDTLKQVKDIIAVASGKGGVGKSTTSVNLALALAQQGYKVGMVDADIYGPSLPMMLGVAEGTRPEIVEQKFFVPVEAQGIKAMSMGFLVTEQTPVVWRAPMATGALMQLLNQTLWGELDYLVIDMPPGTGDIQLTLAQKAKLSGAVIVTTPQDIALLDARKAIEMFHKVNIPVLGIVENMAVHSCSQCGYQEHIFGEGGGKKVALEYDTEVLGALPLSLDIREQADSGRPSVVADPEGSAAKAYGQIARKVVELLSADIAPGGPEIVIE